MGKDLVMVFINDATKKVTIRVKDVKADLSVAAVNSLMDTIVAKDVFRLNGGSLVSKESAKLVESTQEPIEMLTV
ncbi:Protein of unknown function [Clostridium collagenovorans DSM 3089]|uniref:DUF2922 domain-containing protein n=1 Tax=Clostridium collagenovorans DSM 3089 TaxID=1121306 RepID=A0A1M5YB83_9CLOT|nr:DUF2922 domain-containing protein [Clostridium collagenovorans]SHI09098.1 Protein of unknown function [Clostridium collagenovorans DSM 3089]